MNKPFDARQIERQGLVGQASFFVKSRSGVMLSKISGRKFRATANF